MQKLRLYTTSACSLCEQVEAAIYSVQTQFPEQNLVLEKVDIVDDDALLEAYATKIPVLEKYDAQGKLDADAGQLMLPFDGEQLMSWLGVEIPA